MKENGPGAEKEEPGEFRFYDLNDVWGLAANALRIVFNEVKYFEVQFFTSTIESALFSKYLINSVSPFENYAKRLRSIMKNTHTCN